MILRRKKSLPARVYTLLCIAFSMTLPAHVMAQQNTEKQSLSLQQVITLALKKNHDLKLSESAIDSAIAAGMIAGAAPNPTLSLQAANINPKAGIGPGNLRSKAIDNAIRVDQLFERGGKLAYRKASAALLTDAARADALDARRQVRIMVSQSYFDLLASEEKLLVLQQTAALYDTTVTIAQKREKSGDLAGADLARLLVDALRSKNEVVQGEADLLKNRQNLLFLIGRTRQTTAFSLTDSWPATSSLFIEQSDADIEHRPDVIAAKARVDSALAARQLALASRSRDVTVGMQVDHYPVTAGNTQGSGNSFGVYVQIPLFTGYHFEGEIRAAEAGVDVAIEVLEKTRDLAKNDAVQNWQDVSTSLSLLLRFDDNLLVAAKKSADAAEFAFRHGAIGIMDVLDTRRTYKAIELDALSARLTYAKALTTWQATQSENKPL
jgi:cobalt-zinc-cadmium efflux system outer membrane protein